MDEEKKKRSTCVGCDEPLEEGDIAECEAACLDCCGGDCDNCSLKELM